MKESVHDQLRELRTAWLVSILLPLPAMLFWHSHDGRFAALCCFCIGCFNLVARAFRNCGRSEHPARSWRDRMLAAGVALSLAWAVFSLLWVALVDRHDYVALFIAFQILIPSLCIVPYMMLITRQVLAAVVFSAFVLGSMKLLAGVIVNLVYGWGDGHHELPWTNPNLMLSAFWVAAVILSISLCFLGVRRFKFENDRVA
jgi:hypothetical protein